MSLQALVSVRLSADELLLIYFKLGVHNSEPDVLNARDQ